MNGKHMSRTAAPIFAALFLVTTAAAQPPKSKKYGFEGDKAGMPPSGFAFGRTAQIGRPGKWVVETQKDAPSGGKVLGQTDTDDTNARYALAVTHADAAADVAVSVKCKAVSGEVDQACGLVFRYKDENNYYITRSNVLEDNVRLYYVKDGKRKQLATWDGKVPGNAWVTLAAEAKGDAFSVTFNGKKVIEATDQTFSGGGKVGLWTKADSVTYFDDLTVTAL